MSADQAKGLVHSDLTESILGAFYEVYNELGLGFLESVYESALCVALEQRGLCCERQRPVCVMFRGRNIGDFRLDLVVGNLVVVEVKAVTQLLPIHEMQLLNYLKATELKVGLLLNFGPKPQFSRKVS